MEYNLPKKYLSYSAWNLWRTNKDEYRARYYEGKPSIETTETIFGKTIAKKLEDDEKIIGSETRIELEIVPGLKLLGYLDAFDEETYSITEYKTGHLSKDGKEPWSQIKVEKHKQLDWYSLLVKEKYGKVNNTVKLIWLETEFVKESREFGGHILEGETRVLRLTGKERTFRRIIVEWQRKKIKEEIINAAKAISEDYTVWQQKKLENS